MWHSCLNVTLAKKRTGHLYANMRESRSVLYCTRTRDQFSFLKRKIRNQPKAAPECDLCISLSKHKSRVQSEAAPECDLRVSFLKHEHRVQPQLVKFKSKLGSPHPMGSRLVLQVLLLLNWDYFSRKRNVHQIAPQCHCEQLILTVLSDCHCGFQMTKPLIFNRLSKASNSKTTKRRRCCRKKLFSDVEYPEVIFNMVNPSTTLSRKGSK